MSSARSQGQGRAVVGVQLVRGVCRKPAREGQVSSLRGSKEQKEIELEMKQRRYVLVMERKGRVKGIWYIDEGRGC